MEPSPKLLYFLDKYETYFLISHVEPDGDCLSSSLALGRLLEQRGKAVHHFNPGPFIRTEVQPYIPLFSQDPAALPSPKEQEGAIVVLDCSNADRVGEFAKRLHDHPIAVIDHHASREAFGDVTYIDAEAASTTYLVLRVAHALEAPVDTETATHLFFGLCTDTGYFRHLDHGAAHAFRAAAELSELGASPKEAYDRMFGGKTLASRQLNARLIMRARPLASGAGFITWETADDTAEFGRNNRDSDTLYQLMLGTQGCRLVALLREEPNRGCSASLRSNDHTDVAAIARRFGGGGHKRAAGFVVETDLEETKRQLVPELESALAAHAQS